MNERFWVVLLPGPGVYFEGLHKKFWAKQASVKPRLSSIYDCVSFLWSSGHASLKN